jgi:hypothetical protein
MADGFTRDRFNWLDKIAANTSISPGAFRLAYIISTKFLNRKTGDAWPGLDRLAEILGVNEKTVRRLTRELVDAGIMIKKRGGKGKPNRYRMIHDDRTEMSGQSTIIPDNNVHSRDYKTGQKRPVNQLTTGHSCPDDRTNLSLMTGQKCPPNPLNEPIEEPVENITPQFSKHKSTQTEVSRQPGSEIEREFEELWRHYPRKVARGEALRAFKHARKKIDRSTIMAGVLRYAAERHSQDPKFTKHFATWLKAECWEDELTLPRQGGTKDAIDWLHDQAERRENGQHGTTYDAEERLK